MSTSSSTSTLLIRGGQIVTAESSFVADILCHGDTIAQIGPDLPVPAGAEIIEAAGHFVFPGFIDVHTHIHLPFMGTLACDTYATATQAAVIGGTTTVFDMCVPSRSETPLEAIMVWNEKSQGQAACDYCYHLGVTRFDAEIGTQVEALVEMYGLRSLKVFLAYKGAFGIQEEELYHTLKLAKKLGLVVAAHCENETLISQRQEELLAEGKTAPRYHQASRPPFVEASGVNQLLAFSKQTGAEVYIVHLSCQEALKPATEARLRGEPVHIETLIQYLVLDETLANTDDFSGARYVMSPPLRPVENQAVLWEALASGKIDTVSTDHAPFAFASQKVLGEGDFTKIPNGIPALEERVSLLYSYGVATGKISPEIFVKVASTNPAKIFGLYPKKGAIEVGSDADLVIFDPHYRGTLSVKTQHSAVDYNAFEGWEICGRPHVVTVRGKVAAFNGNFIGDPARGQFLGKTKKTALPTTKELPVVSRALSIDTAPLVGRSVGLRYTLEAKIGQGGEAVVYRARYHTAQKMMAIRFPLETPTEPAPIGAPQFHLGWVRCWEIGHDEQLGPFQVLEHLDGPTLTQMVAQRSRLSISLARDLMLQTLESVVLLHKKNWLHGDLHPDNLIWQELQDEDYRGVKQWKLLELPFLSYFPERRDNPAFGNIYTIAPERLAGQKPDFRSELYSLGCIFYFALTGKYPHTGRNSAEVAIGHVKFDPEPIPANFDIFPELENWLFRMLAKKPEERFESAAEAHFKLQELFAYIVRS